jgi:hypothetical protein
MDESLGGRVNDEREPEAGSGHHFMSGFGWSHGAVGTVRAARLHALLSGLNDLELGASGHVEQGVVAAEEGALGGALDFTGVAAGGLLAGVGICEAYTISNKSQ